MLKYIMKETDFVTITEVLENIPDNKASFLKVNKLFKDMLRSKLK